MKIKKYPHGGVHRPVAESTSVQMPDPEMIQRLEDAQEAIDLEDMALQQRRRELPMGFVDDPAGLTSVNPLFEILSLGGPKFFSQVGKAGIKQIAKFIGNTPKSQLDNMAPRDIVLKALDPMDELAERRAKENLEFISERAIKQAGAEDSGALINLQSKSDALLDDAIAKEISERIRLGRQADDIFSQALVDDVTRVRNVGSAKDVSRIENLPGYDKADEYAKLFEELGLSKDQAMTLLEERFMMDPDAVRLPLSAYGKQTKRLNRYGGIVPKKKKKKGMRVKKR